MSRLSRALRQVNLGLSALSSTDWYGLTMTDTPGRIEVSLPGAVAGQAMVFEAGVVRGAPGVYRMTLLGHPDEFLDLEPYTRCPFLREHLAAALADVLFEAVSGHAPAEVVRAAATELTRRRPTRREREALGPVAEAFRAGGIAAVEQRIGTSRATAYRRVRRARALGLLPAKDVTP